MSHPNAGYWGTSHWGTARWGTLEIDSALGIKPAGGFPIGLGDWKVTLELLLPSPAESRWGIGRWGTARWPALAWNDLSSYMRGVSWARGATSVGTRPEVGLMEVTLDNRDFLFSPWNAVSSWNETVVTDPAGNVIPSYFAPGTVIRLAVYSPSGQLDPITDPDTLDPSSRRSWVSLFCGLVSSWTDQTISRGADSLVSITAEETLSSVAQIIVPAVAPVGAGDSPLERITRLLEEGLWKYGPVIDRYLDPLPPVDLELQETTLAANRITDCYLTADSVGAVVRSDRSGLPTIYNRYSSLSVTGIRDGPDASNIVCLAAAGSLVGSSLVVPYVADSVNTQNDDEIIINTVTLGNKGGSVRTGSDARSIALYDPRTLQRSDLIGQSDALLDLLIADELETRALLALRLETLQLHSRQSGALSAQIGIDVDELLEVELPPLIAGYEFTVSRAQVLGMAHTLEPTANGVVWVTDYQFGLQGPLNVQEDN